MQTDTSTHQSHNLIASDRVEGTPVRRSSGEKIGTIERLMIDKLSGNVAYAVLSFGALMGLEHGAMLLGMLVAMLLRLDEYTGHGHHTRAAIAA